MEHRQLVAVAGSDGQAAARRRTQYGCTSWPRLIASHSNQSPHSVATAMAIKRLVRRGHIAKVARGMYRAAGAP